MLRVIRWTMLGLVVLLGAAWLGISFTGASPEGRALETRVMAILGLSAPGPGGFGFGDGIGGPFRLTDTAGQSVTDASFRGRWMLIYFGYTSCPDICPTELTMIAAVLRDLGPNAARVAPLFITVDPARDTGKVLAAYVRLFDPRLIGLTGTPAEISRAARAYRVFYRKVALRDENAYLMDHSSFVYLMGPDGRFVDLFGPGARAADIAASLRSRAGWKN